ncbi:MAG TPA: beta-ketoacyl-[acyl-carrier-protein] synthase family protein [Burkholderiales bacterium]|nr:beta-ketoacyl-[acyl-carrier-protein] synthase family protein [Burkholderiales bacterium]
MSDRRVAVTGLGVLSPVSPGDAAAGAFFDALLAGRSGLRLYAPPDAPRPFAVPAGVCAGFDADALLGKARASTMDRYSQLGVAAGLAAWRDAGLAAARDGDRDDWGVAWGTSLGGALTFERGYRDAFVAGRDRVAPLTVVQAMTNACASHLAIGFGLGGACSTYSVACSSAAIAIGEAMRRVRSGAAPVMLAGGSDAPLAFGVIRAWLALQVLAPGDEGSAPQSCRPFQSARAGLVLAEGAAALVLEDWERAERRGARIYAELAGYGESCDRSNLVRPDRDGQGRALRAALSDAGLAPEELDYVNAHATGTREGDTVEVAALVAALGAHAPRVAVSATKSAHGHPLGAAGAIEAVATVLTLHRGSIPPTLGDPAGLDPDCAGLEHVIGSARGGRGLRAALSNSFAFGGSNAVLAFRAAA